ncbi:MAG: DUF6273 domain-containing protein [Christensenellales bacterium]
MKRFAVAALALLVLVMALSLAAHAEQPESTELSAGSTYSFGCYEQDNNVPNGEEPIEWIVLANDGDKALLLSRYSLDYQVYNSLKNDTTWEVSELRLWLNTVFLEQAFSSVEQDAIVPTIVSSADSEGNPEWQTKGGNDSQDKVFLLSYREASTYFSQQGARKNKGTSSAQALGAKVWPFEETDWWLRSPGKVQQDACYVDRNGANLSNSATNKKGIRPALWFDISANQSEFPATRYAAANILLESGQYEEAAGAFESLGTYRSSAAKTLECRYAQASAVASAGDYASAIKLFELLEDYSDSYDQARENRYRQAVAVQESGQIDEATELFGQLGQYKDSMAHLKACFEAQGISVYYASETAMNVGTDTGYSKGTKIVANDSHFGWRLGRFLMSGFTRVSENADKSPIFLKTLGDKLTLWFDLEQDINHLNKNESLAISEDKNGYDEYFGVAKTNFGRGTLIVRHKDYQNALGDPVIYTDYLAAKESYGADTKVALSEEGDYEVALNYETDAKSYGIINNYNNYSIHFNFSIRNGNTMIFPFDVVTGAELSNSTVTENGFYLDLAKSRYLDINVKRSVLSEGVGGLTEDQRFNRPAKDGDRYTQEGIYTISVLNRYTGEQTEKQFFVGTGELLDEYIENGFSIGN